MTDPSDSAAPVRATSGESALPRAAQQAIAAARGRVERAAAAGDVEGVIGASKDLVEVVAKVVLDVLGQSYGSDTPVQKLASMSMKGLGVAGERPALQRLGGSMATAAGAIGELRNSDGTGHGRSAPSTINAAHAAFARASSVAWCEWMLALAEDKAADTSRFDKALSEIGRDRVFRRGELKAYLEELELGSAPPEIQRKLGLAVARRWTMNSTFMPRMDVIDPLAEGAEDFPRVFQEGLIEGLLLDRDGRVRIDPEDARKAIDIAMRMPAKVRQATLVALADHIDEAAAAPAFGHDAQITVAALFHELATEHERRDPKHALDRIAARLEALAVTSESA